MKPRIDFTNIKISKSNIYMSNIKVEKLGLVDEKEERRKQKQTEKLERRKEKSERRNQRRKERQDRKQKKHENRKIQYELINYKCESNQALNLFVPLKNPLDDHTYIWLNNEVHQGQLNKVVCGVKERREKEIVISVENNGKDQLVGLLNLQIEYLKESFFS